MFSPIQRYEKEARRGPGMWQSRYQLQNADATYPATRLTMSHPKMAGALKLSTVLVSRVMMTGVWLNSFGEYKGGGTGKEPVR